MAKLRHIAISVPDLAASAAFFEKALGLEVVRRTAKRIHLSDGVMNLTLLPPDDLKGDKRQNFVGIHHLGFQVDDTAATGKMVEANGATLVDTPMNHVGGNADRKYWDPNGIMFDISATPWRVAK